MKKLLILLALTPLTGALYAANLSSIPISDSDTVKSNINVNSNVTNNGEKVATNINQISQNSGTLSTVSPPHSSPTCSCAEKNTHVVKKHKKVIHKKILRKNNKPIVVTKDINLNKDNSPIENNLSYSDIIVNVSHQPESHDYLIDMQRKDGQPFAAQDFTPINHTKEKGETAPLFETVWLKSTLDNTQQNQLLFSNDGHYRINVPNSKNKCEAFYFTYQLKGENYPITQAVILGKHGQPSSKMDVACIPKDLNEKISTDYTKDFYTIGVHWKKPYLSNQESVKFNSTVTKAGIDYTPLDFQYYAVNNDFTHLYHFKSTVADPTMAYYGTNFEQFIDYPDNYFFSGSFINEEGKRTYFVTKKAVLNMTKDSADIN